jgi:GH15 family glucan-1,4-alpha-glucosidase
VTGGVGDYALLSDCQSSALVSADGSVDWWPGPRFDGPSVFTRLLDPDAGHFSIRPTEDAATTREYLPGTLVLRTQHRTATGAVSVTDCLALAAGAEGHEIGLRAPHALVRVIDGIDGAVELDVEFVPRLEYGLVLPHIELVRGLAQTRGGPERLFLSGAEDLDIGDRSARGHIRVTAGQRRAFVLLRVARPNTRIPVVPDAATALAGTVAAWRSWAQLHPDEPGPWGDAIDHARLVVQGLTHAPTGAVIGAATTSLPEVPGGDRNWDYRFAWLRDGGFVARALLEVTCSDEARRFFEWSVGAAISCRQSDDVQIVFGPEGERDLHEHELGHLRGFQDSRPVRVGNAAWEQRQLDAFGELLDVADALGDDLVLDAFTGSFLCELADRAAAQWRDPDAGPWEEREVQRHHTFSKAMCWVALDRAIRLAGRLGADARPDHWRAVRDELRETVLREAWSERRQALTGVLGEDELDAAVLLLPLVGFLDARDPRMRSTVRALRDALGDHGLLHRTERIRDGGAFLPTTFWLAAVEAEAGDVRAARETLERGLACANDLGLLAELGDPRTSEPMGNVPQVLSHIAAVTAIGRLRAATAEVAA